MSSHKLEEKNDDEETSYDDRRETSSSERQTGYWKGPKSTQSSQANGTFQTGRHRHGQAWFLAGRRGVHKKKGTVDGAMLIAEFAGRQNRRQENHRCPSASLRRLLQNARHICQGEWPMKFQLGQIIVATPGALEAFRASGESPLTVLQRHLAGDWADLDAHDTRENELSLQHGWRILLATIEDAIG
jgi:hypothetical protein